MRKGILLACGSGTRLHPITRVVSKPLLPLYDKPMIYYPLTVLMLAGVREIAIITTPHDQDQFRRLLGDGSDFGLELTWLTQPSPDGLAQAYLIAESFLDGASSAMVLGDNIFFGHGLPELLAAAYARREGPSVFGYQVADPGRHGVVDFDENLACAASRRSRRGRNRATRSRALISWTGARRSSRALRPSARGELEIADLLMRYLEEDALEVMLMGRGFAWPDTGTHDSLIDAGAFVRTIEERQGLKIGAPEEVACRLGLIDRDRLVALGEALKKTGYGQYLLAIAKETASDPQPSPAPRQGS